MIYNKYQKLGSERVKLLHTSTFRKFSFCPVLNKSKFELTEMSGVQLTLGARILILTRASTAKNMVNPTLM